MKNEITYLIKDHGEERVHDLTMKAVKYLNQLPGEKPSDIHLLEIFHFITYHRMRKAEPLISITTDGLRVYVDVSEQN